VGEFLAANAAVASVWHKEAVLVGRVAAAACREREVSPMHAEFYCVNCYNKGKAAPKSDYRPAVRIGGGREFMRLSSSDLEALVAGLALKAEEESVMDPEMPCRRRRSDVEDKD